MIKKKTWVISLALMILAAAPAEAAEGSRQWQRCLEKPQIPDTMVLRFTDGDGAEKETEGRLKRVEEHPSNATESFKVRCRFVGDKDSQYYCLGEKKIYLEKGMPDFSGYKDTILEHLNLDQEHFKIKGGNWISDYIEEDGEIVRYAEFTGEAGNFTDYVAYYEAETPVITVESTEPENELAEEPREENVAAANDESQTEAVGATSAEKSGDPEEAIMEEQRGSESAEPAKINIQPALLMFTVAIGTAAVFVNLQRKRLNRG